MTFAVLVCYSLHSPSVAAYNTVFLVFEWNYRCSNDKLITTVLMRCLCIECLQFLRESRTAIAIVHCGCPVHQSFVYNHCCHDKSGTATYACCHFGQSGCQWALLFCGVLLHIHQFGLRHQCQFRFPVVTHISGLLSILSPEA